MSAQEFKDLGNKAFQSGQYHEAVEHYSNAIALDDNHVLYSNRSGAYAGLKQWTDALEDADLCISTNPSYAKGYSRRATALVGLGHYKDAATAYQEALKIDPNNQSYQDELRQCIAAQKPITPPPTAAPFAGMGGNGMDDMFNPFGPQMIQKLEANPQTKQLLQNSSTRAALEDIAKNPQNLEKHTSNQAVMMCLQSLLGISPEEQMRMAQEEHNQEQQKKKRQDAAENSRPRFAAPAMERDTTPTSNQPPQDEEDVEIDEELEKEKREKKEKREQADQVKEQGAVEYKAKRFPEAIVFFQQAIDIDDTNPVYSMNIAACHFELKEFDQCIAACKAALNISGPITSLQKGKIYSRLAHAYLKQTEYQFAIDAFKRSLLEENSPQVRQQLRAAEQSFKKHQIESYYDEEKSELAKEAGNKAFSDAEYGKAIDCYTDAIKRNPKNYKVYSNRALCYIKVCAWEKAMEDCDMCLSFEPKFVRALIRKGKVLHFLKSYHKATEVFREALEIAPHDEELLEAMQATQRAIYSSPNDPAAQEARMAEAMKDPEIQFAMANPRIQKLLDEMQKDPNAAMAAFNNPEVAPILEKLIAAGIIRLG